MCLVEFVCVLLYSAVAHSPAGERCATWNSCLCIPSVYMLIAMVSLFGRRNLCMEFMHGWVSSVYDEMLWFFAPTEENEDNRTAYRGIYTRLPFLCL